MQLHQSAYLANILFFHLPIPAVGDSPHYNFELCIPITGPIGLGTYYQHYPHHNSLSTTNTNTKQKKDLENHNRTKC